MKKHLILPFFLLIFSLFGCGSRADSPEAVASNFWQAVIAKDMEKAKSFATWDTVEYLKYLNTNKTHPERFDLGEKMIGEKNAEIAVTLYTKAEGQQSVRIPGKTVLVKTEQGWRVDVKNSLGSVVKQTVNNVFDQLNNMLQKGVNELDKSFAKSMDELGKNLEESAKELKQELDKAIPNSSGTENSRAQEI
ncbi:MAG: hypothetical protein DSZ29_06870 [Aquificaceae bacterium]|nr:MAG: hypothetical protein DSZ29_06870 [Aquificaceae bacterium]